jgi:hypothetical protein
MSVAAFADEQERERARQRTYDALERKARALHVTGGRVYGYDNVEVRAPDGRRLHVVRQVNPEQAAVVRRIFALCAEGQGFTRIAKAFNEDLVAPPRRASGWAPTAVREILLRRSLPTNRAGSVRAPMPQIPTSSPPDGPSPERSAPVGSPQPVCSVCAGPRDTRKREACSDRCRAALSRRRRKDAQSTRDGEIRALLETALTKLGETAHESSSIP